MTVIKDALRAYHRSLMNDFHDHEGIETWRKEREAWLKRKRARKLQKLARRKSR